MNWFSFVRRLFNIHGLRVRLAIESVLQIIQNQKQLFHDWVDDNFIIFVSTTKQGYLWGTWGLAKKKMKEITQNPKEVMWCDVCCGVRKSSAILMLAWSNLCKTVKWNWKQSRKTNDIQLTLKWHRINIDENEREVRRGRVDSRQSHYIELDNDKFP